MADFALTAEQRERLTELFDEHLFEINLEDDDLVFYAECEDSGVGAYSQLLTGVHSVEEIARVPLRAVISHAIEFAIDESEDETEARNALFAMAGRLREAVTLIEYQAIKIGASIEDEEESPTLLTVEKLESMKALRRETNRGSKADGNGDGTEPQ